MLVTVTMTIKKDITIILFISLSIYLFIYLSNICLLAVSLPFCNTNSEIVQGYEVATFWRESSEGNGRFKVNLS